MGKKLEDYEYKGIDDFEDDFNIMVGNCLSYNERDTIFFRAGVKMRDQGGLIIRQAKREVENIGFDPETGLHTTERLTPKEEFSDDKLMKEIDNFVNDDAREDMPLEVHLKRLLELQDKAMHLHHPVAKVKRQKLLKQEITKVRRKLSMGKAGTTPGGPKHPKQSDKDTEDEDKHKKNLDESNLNKTPVKSVQNSSSPAKSPAGVNR